MSVNTVSEHKMKSQVKVSLRSSEFKLSTEEVLKYRQFNTEFIDFRSTDLNIKCGKTLNQRTLNGGSTVLSSCILQMKQKQHSCQHALKIRSDIHFQFNRTYLKVAIDSAVDSFPSRSTRNSASLLAR
jgi:hypothetical protein